MTNVIDTVETPIDINTYKLWITQGQEGVPGRYGTSSWTAQQIRAAVEAVGRGAVLLDEKKPGWVEQILPEKLNMADGSFCIIGQAYGTYDKVGIPFGMEAINYEAEEELDAKAIGYGFYADDDDDPPYELLDRVWVYLLTERRNGGERVILTLPDLN